MNKVNILCDTCNKSYFMSEEGVRAGIFVEQDSGLIFSSTECINCQKKVLRADK